MSERGDYYYAAGERIELDRADDLIAIDDARLSEADLPSAVRREARDAARSLRSGVSMIDRAALSDKAVDALQQARVTLPVFRQGSSILIALPEIRAEGGEADGDRVQAWLEEHGEKAEVERGKRGQIVVKPAPGRADAALQLANQLHEQLGIESAQTRMLRIVERPEPGPKRDSRP